MSQFLTPKTYFFTKEAFCLRKSKKSPHNSRLSEHLNIAKLSNSPYRNTNFFTNTRLNIGVGIKQRKKLPESTLCEIIDYSDMQSPLSKKLSGKVGLVDSFYTRRKTSMRTLSALQSESIKEISDVSVDESLETDCYLTSHKYFQLKTPEKSGKTERNQFRARLKIRQKVYSEARACISVQTDDLDS